MLEIHKQAAAEEDLIDIWLYSLERWGEDQADTYLDHLNESITRIADNPKIGTDCSAIRRGYRRLHIQHHMVYYRVLADEISVVRVLHENMLPERHL